MPTPLPNLNVSFPAPPTRFSNDENVNVPLMFPDYASDYYVVGYYSSNPDPLKKRRRLDVNVSRPGVNVLHRTEYTLKAPPVPKPNSAFQSPGVQIAGFVASTIESPLALCVPACHPHGPASLCSRECFSKKHTGHRKTPCWVFFSVKSQL